MKTKTLLLITFFGLLMNLELKAQQCGTPQTTNFPSSQRTLINKNLLKSQIDNGTAKSFLLLLIFVLNFL